MILCLLYALFTVFTVTQQPFDSKSRMRESCTSGSVGAPAERSLGPPDNVIGVPSGERGGNSLTRYPQPFLETPMPPTQTLVVNTQPREKTYRLFDDSGLYLAVRSIT